jgi:hypothetical protein
VLDKTARARVLLFRESVRTAHTRRFWQSVMLRDTPGLGRYLVPVRLVGFRVAAPFRRPLAGRPVQAPLPSRA